MSGRQDVIDYLRWLADQPDGVRHRDWLFRAAIIIKRDHETMLAASVPLLSEHHSHDRRGDETI